MWYKKGERENWVKRRETFKIKNGTKNEKRNIEQPKRQYIMRAKRRWITNNKRRKSDKDNIRKKVKWMQ